MKRITIELDTSAMYPGIPRINEEAARILRAIADDIEQLAMATQYTGKTYKRTQMEQAAEDVKHWADTMKAALPTTDNRQA